MPLYDELFALEGTEKIPGGSSLNSVRAANHMLRDTHPKKCAFLGCIGNDEFGKVLEHNLEEGGVHGILHKDADTPTGTCAVLVVKKERSLCANLAACLKYPLDHLKENLHIVSKA